MKAIFFIILFIVMQTATAQTALTDYFIVNDVRIEVKITKDKGNYILKLTKEGSDPETINLGKNVGDYFEFKKQFRSKTDSLVRLTSEWSSGGLSEADYKKFIDQINEKAESLYFSFANNLRVLDGLDNKPKSGDLSVNKRIPVYIKKSSMRLLRKTYQDEVAKKAFQELVIEEQHQILAIETLDELPDSLIMQEISGVKEILDKEQKLKAIKTKAVSFDSQSAEYILLQKKFIDNYYNNQYNPDNAENVVLTYFIIENVTFEFSKGFLEVLNVTGTFDCDDENKYNCGLLPSFLKNDAELIFTNKFGIGFTSRDNYWKLQNISLYLNDSKKSFSKGDFNTIDVDNYVYREILKKGRRLKLKRNDKLKEKKHGSGIFLKMDDLINYNFEVNRLTRDFSPKDQKLVVSGGKTVKLTKDETKKILEVEVFSDFEGFDADAPNGLLQTELTKHFNLNTVRKDSWDVIPGDGFGFLQYLELSGALIKIEDKERRYSPERIDMPVQNSNGDSVINSQRFATPIDLITHRTWNIGADLNLVLLDSPDWKYQFHLNGGLRFNRTAIQDSIASVNSEILTPEEYSVSFWNFYGEARLHILPEERYGFYAMWRPNYVYLTSDRLDLRAPADPITGTRRNMSNWVNEFELKGYVDVGDNGQLFLRWRLFHEMGYTANNFSQIQLGFSFYLLGRNKEPTGN